MEPDIRADPEPTDSSAEGPATEAALERGFQQLVVPCMADQTSVPRIGQLAREMLHERRSSVGLSRTMLREKLADFDIFTACYVFAEICFRRN